jgi:hypothetical protein
VNVAARPNAITSLQVSPPTMTLPLGQSGSITSNAQAAAGSVAVIYGYQSGNLGVATVTPQGSVVGVGAGTTAITVTATGSGTGYTTNSISQLVTVTVTGALPGLDSVSVTPSSVTSLVVGQGRQLSAKVYGPAATTTALNASYSSTPTSIATVVTNSIASDVVAGTVTGVAPGAATVTITVSSPATSQLSATTVSRTVPITVLNSAAACTALTLNNTNISVAQSATATLIPTITAGAGVTATQAWVTGNASVASVSPAGVVTGVAPGATTITLNLTCSGTGFTTNSLQAIANVTVTGGSTLAPITSWRYNLIGSSLQAASLRRGWAASATTWFVVGVDNTLNAGGGIWRTTDNGATWTRLNLTTSDNLIAVTGTSATNVYVLSSAGTIWRFDGSSFTQVRAAGGFTEVFDIAVAGTTVFVLGNNGGPPRLERSLAGGAFAVMSLPTTAVLSTLAGAGTTEAYAAGDSGLVLAYNGTAWTRAFQHPSKGYINEVVSTGPGTAFAGGTVFPGGNPAAFHARLASGTWSALTPPNTGYADDLAAGSNANEFYSFDYPSKVWRFDGAAWTLVSPGSSNWDDARTIFSPAPGTVVAVGDPWASVQLLNNSQWVTKTATPDLLGAAAFSTSRYYAAGTLRTVWRWDGNALSTLATLTKTTGLSRIVVNALDDLLATDGFCMYRVTSGNDVQLGCSGSGVSDMAGGGALPTFAVGAAGYIASVSTSAVTSMNSGTTQLLNAVWVSSSTLAMAGGINTLLRYNGTTWAPFTAPIAGNYTIYSIWGSSATDIFCHLEDGTNNDRIFRWNGSSWTAVALQAPLASGLISGNGISNGLNDAYITTYSGVVRISGGGTTQAMVWPSIFSYWSFPTSVSIVPTTGGGALAVGSNLTFNYGTSASAGFSLFGSRSAAPVQYQLDQATLNAGGGLRRARSTKSSDEQLRVQTMRNGGVAARGVSRIRR